MSADTLPPHDTEAEQGLLGCILLDDAACWPEIDRAGVSARWFFDGRHAEFFSIAKELRENGRRADVQGVWARLKELGRPHENCTLLADLPNAAPTAENLTYWLAPLRERFLRRTIIQRATEASAAARNGEALDDVLARAEGLANLARIHSQGDLGSQIEARRFDPAAKPPAIRPVFSLLGRPVCTPGNLTTLTAQAKAGKSAVLSAMLAATFARTGADCLGFESGNPDGLAILHFDTEQSREDHWHLVARTLRRAQAAALPEWLMSYCLTGFKAARIQEAVWLKAEEARKQFGGLHSVHIDGSADLVADVNDAEECNRFVARLHALAIEFDCAISGVVHFNPGTEKTRGHLGSQLERKSETNLRIDKEGDVSSIWSEKQRRAPILKGTGPRFKWSDEAGMHVSIESGADARTEAKRAEAILLRDDVFQGRASMRYSDIANEAQNLLRLSPATAKRRISEWVHLQIIEKSVAGLWIPKG